MCERHWQVLLALPGSGYCVLVYSSRRLHAALATYYRCNAGGVDFNEDDSPAYLDFAHLSFTIGTTFQVCRTLDLPLDTA